jgi:predicted branched-subunit amino acid permease
LTTLLTNLPYILMSLSLSQKIRPGISLPYRLAIGYGITDEVYAVAIHRPGALGPAYCLSLMALPVSGWTTGTLLGALAGTILPDTLRSALGIALYAMFVAIVMPSTRQSRPIRLVVLLAAALSTLIAAWPRLSALRGVWQIIIATILAALAGAWFAPIQDSGPTARPAAGGAGHD